MPAIAYIAMWLWNGRKAFLYLSACTQNLMKSKKPLCLTFLHMLKWSTSGKSIPRTATKLSAPRSTRGKLLKISGTSQIGIVSCIALWKTRPLSNQITRTQEPC